MTLYEFRQLTEDQQYGIITNKAVQISEYRKGSYEFCLFQVFSFYVESRFNLNRVETTIIRTLTPEEIPDPYLLQIDINGLI